MIVQTQTTSFKRELYEGIHVFGADEFRVALFTAFASLNADTELYAPTGEVVGPGYTAGGVLLTGVTVSSGSGVAWVSFDNALWSPASFTARCALIYNASKGNRSVAVLDFGSDKQATTQFQITMPPATAQTALIRSA